MRQQGRSVSESESFGEARDLRAGLDALAGSDLAGPDRLALYRGFHRAALAVAIADKVAFHSATVQAMPEQNRVTPRSEIVATSLRGMFMGNRGRLHEGHEIVRN